MSDKQPEDRATGPETPGRALAAARNSRGMTVTEVALRLKFAPRQIEALESERYELLAGPAFVRGMIRAYAKLVGADGDALVAGLPAQVVAAGPTEVGPPALEVPFPRSPRRGSFVYATLSALLVVAVAGVALEWLLRPVAQPIPIATAPAAVAPVSAPVPVAPATEQPAENTAVAAAATREQAPAEILTAVASAAGEAMMPGGKRIELVFNSESWVEIRDVEGRVLFSQLNPPGTRREVAGAGPFSLVIGNAAGVTVRYNDSEVDLRPFTRIAVARLTLE